MTTRKAPASEAGSEGAADEAFEFLGEGGRGVIRDFVQGRDRISLVPLGLTPDDLLISDEGADLVLAFEGGEVVLLGRAGLTLTEADFRF